MTRLLDVLPAQVTYEADTQLVASIVHGMSDTRLQRMLDAVRDVPELFPSGLAALLDEEAGNRGWGGYGHLAASVSGWSDHPLATTVRGESPAEFWCVNEGDWRPADRRGHLWFCNWCGERMDDLTPMLAPS